MSTGIKSILNHQLTIDNSCKEPIKQPPINAVDRIADSLVKEYANPGFRRWYCGIIYEFGIQQVFEWQSRAKEGKEPAKLFSAYVKEARIYKKRPLQ